ncbi:NADPH oxidase organizer 1-like [Melanerpes formicivorus]|uniref:NADPH oxidase organizer 1-like n=1 Tax=Melanerpes formicivorus TaxID=211600 RepID=UPI00358E96BC
MSCCRYPVDVRAVGLMQWGKQKSYMMVVSWSDQNNLLIYRTFEDFRRLHKQLKRKFPSESGSVRKIPRFKDASVKQRKSGKPKRSLEVLRVLETYSQKLLKTEAQISQGEEVIQFFKAQTQDLDPSFPKDSLVIMPSEVGRGEKAQRGKQLPPITAPQATQSYRCIQAFETKDTKNKAFQVSQEDILEVLMKDRSGWWLVENTDKQLAWFPASYLEEIDVHRDIQSALASKEEGSLHFVVQAYECQAADELSLSSGVLVQVLRTSDNGWWLIRYNGSTGYVPCICLKPYRNPHHKLHTAVDCGLNASTPSLCSPPEEAAGHPRVQVCSSLAQTEEELSSQRGRSRSLPRASSTPELELDSLSLSSGSKEQDNLLSWQPNLSRSLPEVEQARSSALGQHLATHSSKAPGLSHRDRNDSGFVESSAADLSSPLAGPELAPAAPRVPARPSAQEILQRCSTVTRRALQCPPAPQPLPPLH